MSHDTRGNFFGHYHRKDQLTNERGYKVVPPLCTRLCTYLFASSVGINIFAVENQIVSIMMVISPSEFRANLRKYFDLAHTERVIIRRSKGQSFALVPTHDDELTISDQLKKKIAKAREDFRVGKGTACKTVEDSLELLESL